MTVKYELGCDVSENNGYIDFNQLAKEGIKFAMIRIGYGVSGTVDSMFIDNVNAAHEAGLKVGGFYFSYSKNINGIKEEANRCIDIVNRAGVLIDYPIMLDEEPTSYRPFGMLEDNLTEMISNWLDIMRMAKLDCGVYADLDWLNREIDWKSLNCAIWNAQVNDNHEINIADITQEYLGNQNDEIGGFMHQFTWRGKSTALNGDLDLDYIYREEE